MARQEREAAIRTTITDDEISGFRVSIRSERNLGLILFLSLWLVGWAIGELAALSWVVLVPLVALAWATGLLPREIQEAIAQGIAQTETGQIGGSAIFLLVWLIFWTFAGMLVFHAWRWQLGGRELITIHDNVLELRREIGGKSRAQTFDLDRARDLRYSPEPMTRLNLNPREAREQMRRMLGVGGGNVAFEYEGQSRRFGIGLPELEARRLIATIRERYKISEDGPGPLPVSAI